MAALSRRDFIHQREGFNWGRWHFGGVFHHARDQLVATLHHFVFTKQHRSNDVFTLHSARIIEAIIVGYSAPDFGCDDCEARIDELVARDAALPIVFRVASFHAKVDDPVARPGQMRA